MSSIWLRQAVNNTADGLCSNGASSGEATPRRDGSATETAATGSTGAAGDGVPPLEQCLGCETLMAQLRETSDEAEQLRVRLAEAIESLQVTLALASALVALSSMQACGVQH